MAKEGLTKSQPKIADYDRFERDVYYGKEGVSEALPQMILVFNSHRRVLKLNGFPCLMKEKAEIFECGGFNSDEFRAIDFVQCIERYASIEQRWGK